MDFAKRIVPPDRQQLFTMDGYYIWDGSMVRDGQGVYHLFGSRWPAELGMRAWLTHSKVIRAEADSPTGPFEFKEEIEAVNAQPWARHMAHNPRIHEIDGTFYLFYIGTNWGDDDPYEAAAGDRDRWERIRFRQRIGAARADRPQGPWTPLEDNPVLEPRSDCWDAKITVNPSIRQLADGRILMIYKSTLDSGHPLILGAAVADRPEGPYERTGPSPLFEDDVEDPCFWKEDGRQWMLVKDMRGDVCGVRGAGALYESAGGLRWRQHDPVFAYGLTIDWTDAPSERARNVERPYVYLEDGRPRCFLTAVRFEDRPSGILVRRLR